MRDILVLFVVFATLPLIPFRPFLGLLLFSWLAYMRPADIAWTIGAERFSFYVALAMLLGLVLAMGRERFAVFRLQTILMIALAVWFFITGETAINPRLAERWVELFLKVILIAVLTTGLVRTRSRLRILLVVIAFSLGLLGLKYGLFGVLRGGAEINRGPGGFMGDRNGFALALNMSIPLLAGIAFAEESKLLRVGALVLLPFTVLAVVFTFSRGGFLTLAVLGALLILRSGRPIIAVLALAISLGGFFYLTSDAFQERYLNRARTIQEYDEDASAMGRIAAWKTAIRMSEDYPIFGVGPDNFMSLYSRYSEPGETVRVTHNAFLQFLSENGYPALILFVALLLITAWRLDRVRRRSDDKWLAAQASAIQISIAAYVVGAMLLDKAYFDLLYHLVGISVCLETVAAQAGEVEPTSEPLPAADIPWWRQPQAAEGEGIR